MTIALVKIFHFKVSFILEINLGWIYVKLDVRRKRRSQLLTSTLDAIFHSF